VLGWYVICDCCGKLCWCMLDWLEVGTSGQELQLLPYEEEDTCMLDWLEVGASGVSSAHDAGGSHP
jgi:hypothetical protein